MMEYDNNLLLVLLLVALQLVDAATTRIIIKQGGYEANKVLVALSNFLRLFTNARWAWLVAAKVFAATMIWTYLRHETGALVACVMLYGVVCIHNWSSIKSR